MTRNKRASRPFSRGSGSRAGAFQKSRYKNIVANQYNVVNQVSVLPRFEVHHAS